MNLKVGWGVWGSCGCTIGSSIKYSQESTLVKVRERSLDGAQGSYLISLAAPFEHFKSNTFQIDVEKEKVNFPGVICRTICLYSAH